MRHISGYPENTSVAVLILPSIMNTETEYKLTPFGNIGERPKLNVADKRHRSTGMYHARLWLALYEESEQLMTKNERLLPKL